MNNEISSVARIREAYLERLVKDIRKEPEQIEQKKEVKQVQKDNQVDKLV